MERDSHLAGFSEYKELLLLFILYVFIIIYF